MSFFCLHVCFFICYFFSSWQCPSCSYTLSSLFVLSLPFNVFLNSCFSLSSSPLSSQCFFHLFFVFFFVFLSLISYSSLKWHLFNKRKGRYIIFKCVWLKCLFFSLSLPLFPACSSIFLCLHLACVQSELRFSAAGVHYQQREEKRLCCGAMFVCLYTI